MFLFFWPGSGAGLLPTSHIKISRGRVAHAFHIRRHALVLPLVSLLTVLDLQGTWEIRQHPTKTRREGERDKKREKESREGMISWSVSDSAWRSQTLFLMEGILNISGSFCQEVLLSAMLMQIAMTNWVPLQPQPSTDKKKWNEINKTVDWISHTKFVGCYVGVKVVQLM